MNSKVALVGDLHFGIHNDSKPFQDSQFAFLEQLVRECKGREISEIFVLGDLFDSRHSVNVMTVNRVMEFFKEHEYDGLTWNIILGNHDLYYKNSLDVSSLVILERFQNVRIVDRPKEVGIDYEQFLESDSKEQMFMVKYDTLMVPWITDFESFRNEVETKRDCKRLFGHLDVIGAKMDVFNNVSENGFDVEELFKHWKYIYTGHYHSRSQMVSGDCRLVYVGSPYQLSRAEIEEKGFYILDTSTEDLEFVKNEVSIEFKKLTYPDLPENVEDLVKGNIVDVDISWEDSKYMNKVNEYLDKLESFKPAYPINPIYQRKREPNKIEKINMSGITILSLGKRYIDDSEDIKNKGKVFEEFKKLYSHHEIH